jgi:hypothetical protein
MSDWLVLEDRVSLCVTCWSAGANAHDVIGVGGEINRLPKGGTTNSVWPLAVGTILLSLK